jgi:hypothetical protein
MEKMEAYFLSFANTQSIKPSTSNIVIIPTHIPALKIPSTRSQEVKDKMRENSRKCSTIFFI